MEYPKDGYVKQKHAIIGGKQKYITCFGCFDIETSNHALPNAGHEDDIISVMYLWQFCDSDKVAYFGRTWTDFRRLVRQLIRTYQLSKDKRMVCYIHNASFEFQFIRSVLDISEVFATDIRKVVKFVAEDCIEFRCSYRLSNMSLEKFCQSQQTGFEKISGYDYDKERFPDTQLSDFELTYGMMDVIAMRKAIVKLMASENDDLSSIPLTSTGYVRREARQRCADKNNAILLKRTALDEHQYKMCKSATRGGDVHANILYIGNILHEVYSYDRSSSYPHVMVTGGSFPVSEYVVERQIAEIKAPPKGLSAVMLVEYTNLRLKPDCYMPYLPFSRAVEIRHPKWNDNGRVIACETYVATITEVDFEIIEKEYDYDDVFFHELMLADKGHLPKCYREYIMELYTRKSELKSGDKYYYDKFKNKLNSTFGMMLTDITREEIVYRDVEWIDGILPDITKALRKYYNSPKSFLQYQAGIYVTALARKELRRSIEICGRDTVYVDTDSNKHINDHSEDFKLLNQQIHTENMANDIVPIVTVNGKSYEMGIWEDEGDGKPMYSEFVTMGAKKYAYRYQDGKYGVTVAGLNKKDGAKYLSNVGLDEFQNGLIFDPTFAGRLTAKYDDRVRLEVVEIKGHRCEITSNVALIPTTYTLTLEKNFANAVNAIQNGELN